MGESEYIEKWVNNFMEYLWENDKELVPFFTGRFNFPQNAKGETTAGYLPLDETLATKEQIVRMDKVFYEYLEHHPI